MAGMVSAVLAARELDKRVDGNCELYLVSALCWSFFDHFYVCYRGHSVSIPLILILFNFQK